MIKYSRFIVLILASLFSSFSHAIITVSDYTYHNSYGTYSDKDSACNTLFSQYSADSILSAKADILKSGGSSDYYLQCTVTLKPFGSNNFMSFSISPVCPVNSTKLKYNTCTCLSGFLEEDGKCIDPNAPPENSCNSNEQSSFYIPIAWGRIYPGNSGSIALADGGSVTPDQSTYKAPPSFVCAGSCGFTFLEDQSNSVNLDVSSGTGFNRIDSLSLYQNTGLSCTENTNFDNNVGNAPPCDGDLGTVNGLQYCVGNGSGNGSDNGDGSGNGSDSGSGNGDGSGNGSDSGSGNGDGSGNGSDSGSGNGDGSGNGSGSGSGSGNGSGSGSGNGDGSDNGNGSGSGGSASHGNWEVPKIYESKYPDGISGVYQSSGLKEASGMFDGLVNAFVPKFSDSNGTCQSFSISLDMGIVNFGRFDFSPPCILWPFLWLVLQITAIFTFRALVFGG